MGLLVAILGGIAAAVYAVIYLMRAADEGKDTVRDVKNAVRRGQWSKQVDARLIENISDPRESAAILLAQIASYEGEITVAQKTKMIELMIASFNVPADEAEGLYSYGRMAIGQINDAANSLSKLLRPVKDALTLAEMKELVSMLESVAEVEGAPSERQRDLVMQIRRYLSLDHVH